MRIFKAGFAILICMFSFSTFADNRSDTYHVSVFQKNTDKKTELYSRTCLLEEKKCDLEAILFDKNGMRYPVTFQFTSGQKDVVVNVKFKDGYFSLKKEKRDYREEIISYNSVEILSLYIPNPWHKPKSEDAVLKKHELYPTLKKLADLEIAVSK